MNKHIVSTLALAAFVVATTAPALADQSPSPSPSASPGIRRNESREDINDARKAAQREKREQERNNRLAKFWKKTGERLQKLINRETKVADKIAARLKKFKDAGKNVSTQETMLADARLKITAAQTALSSAVAEIKKMIADGKPVADIIVKARELHKGVVAAIRTAHKALIDVIVSTRGMSITPTPTPTPTP